MTIGILLCGDIPAALEAEFGPYSGMIRRLLGSRSATVFDVQSGELPRSISACEAYVITGSNAGVYDRLPWINDLMAFLRNARGGSKLIGICFGHQAMAQAFGGSVIKSPKGWGIGLHRYELHAGPYWMGDDAAVAVPASHQDQVVASPSDARVIASSEFTPYAALDYGDAISFQFHPEFSPAFATALIEVDRDRYGALAASAIQSLAARRLRPGRSLDRPLPRFWRGPRPLRVDDAATLATRVGLDSARGLEAVDSAGMSERIGISRMPLSSTSSSTADLSRTAAKFKVGGRLCHAGIILLDVGRRASQGV